eukprot:4161539-Alexandrium_andersonii.AAC.1
MATKDPIAPDSFLGIQNALAKHISQFDRADRARLPLCHPLASDAPLLNTVHRETSQIVPVRSITPDKDCCLGVNSKDSHLREGLGMQKKERLE